MAFTCLFVSCELDGEKVKEKHCSEEVLYGVMLPYPAMKYYKNDETGQKLGEKTSHHRSTPNGTFFGVRRTKIFNGPLSICKDIF